MADITYIPIRQLHPHPDNPRKELGDLSELAASIKENGVYQNLTVIPGHYLSSREYISKCVDEGGDAAAAAAAWAPKVMWVGDDYTIIIGHRRAAAAQQAGLYELPEILAYSTPVLTEYRHMEDDENVLQLLGIGLDEQIREDTELEDALKMFNAYDTEPEKILLAVAFDATDSSREGYWSTEWNGPTGASKFVHRKNDDLDSTYELLAALGYEMADDEKALQDGTHQLFAVYGSGSQADTPCDKCKAAHPECDKCCKTCDDHCNAFQLCRKEYGE